MDKYIFDKNNGLWYELIGDYYLAFYNALLLSGKLNGYLADIDRQAQEQMVTVIRQMSKAQGITEVLKATNQAEWVGMMNNICFAAVEMIHDEIIYA